MMMCIIARSKIVKNCIIYYYISYYFPESKELSSNVRLYLTSTSKLKENELTMKSNQKQLQIN